ncbi:UDP-3-O-(3-hydroxymyristoyl)glucosamine N-acyltransferase [Alkalimonas delamerensis]|uniref:UDP-3-O-acylglucosamine N-acyltransferase n=1 Tax=Alkalimonas delamerensis TaxID=265981 RepID=A0ABT9GM50_9GAMM|nr:UDP-3-O-(3-hydroxymyristoyl)glucosamine N-acyltransferase [Alkalimonas delamerensis]MDP4528032.1 UDP-3-O-(3-hydroxymyristoyl)glucosamine N-acyltransferase [Alkalimonas delamerensis]
MKAWTALQLAQHLDAELVGSESLEITGVGTLERARPDQVSFLSNPKLKHLLPACQAGLLLLRPDDKSLWSGAALLVADPYVAFAKLAQLLDSTPPAALGIHPSAQIDPSASLGKGVSIGPYAVISAGAVIGDNSEVGAHCFVGESAKLGEGCRIWPNVTIYHRVELGNHCIVHSGATLGADGFGFANEGGRWLKIPQVGTVLIGDDCEIGAQTCIDRGAIEDTVIGDNVIIDNLCQIAHNVRIGDHTAIAGCTTIAGSTTIGRYCIIGGAAVINGHIEICDGAQISGMAMLMKPVTEKGVYTSGIPATTNAEWRKNTARLRKIDQLYQRVKELEQRLDDVLTDSN